MSTNLHINVYLPEGAQFDIDAKGVTHNVDGSPTWQMPLAEAEKRLEAALRSVRVLLEVEPGRGDLLAESRGHEATTCGGTDGTDPARLPAPPPSPAPSPQEWFEHCTDNRCQYPCGQCRLPMPPLKDWPREDSTRVREAEVAEAPGCDPEGRGFESLPAPYCPFCQAPTCSCWENHECR